MQEADPQKTSRWYTLERRPYITGPERRQVVRKTHNKLLKLSPDTLSCPYIFHASFTPDEVECLRQFAAQSLSLPANENKGTAKQNLTRLIKKNASMRLPRILARLERECPIKGRTKADVKAFLTDLSKGDTERSANVLSLQKDDPRRQWSAVRSSRVPALLLAREVAGYRGYASMRNPQNFTNEFKKCREDAMELRAEWTNCAGDITTVTWVSDDAFICGTTEHSDSHNQQYNKPGNLVLGSCSKRKAQAYPQHRIVRPIIEQGENSTEAMRQSQDPWLYTSVVSSDYDPIHDHAFTSSFDRTVKVWRAKRDGSSMSLLGTWPHEGNVNFVVTSKHDTAMVATAADVPYAAIRIYHVDDQDVSNSPFRSYSCSRILDLEGNVVHTDTWGYFPATVRWGLSPSVRHLLLVGYSPRSLTTDDNNIPEDKRDSGELCLWDGLTGERWRVMSASTQNVFEVLWHPSQPSFIAATSPLGLELADWVHTQIRIFRISDNNEYGGKAYASVQTLDCGAVDINELSIQ